MNILRLLVTFLAIFASLLSHASSKVKLPLGGYYLGMDKARALEISPAHKIIEKDTLGVSGIYFYKNSLKYSIWFYKGKVHGIIVEGKLKENFRKAVVKRISALLGSPAQVREFISTNYYWYFTKNALLYTVEVKAYIIDIHYSISDTGRGIN